MARSQNDHVKKIAAKRLLKALTHAVQQWPRHAEAATVDDRNLARIEKSFRTELFL
jgi:hypothetical protein